MRRKVAHESRKKALDFGGNTNHVTFGLGLGLGLGLRLGGGRRILLVLDMGL